MSKDIKTLYESLVGGYWWKICEFENVIEIIPNSPFTLVNQYGVYNAQYVKYRGSISPTSTTISSTASIVTDADIQTALKTYISSNISFFSDSTKFSKNLYFPVHLDSNFIVTRVRGNKIETSCVDFCAYHSYVTVTWSITEENKPSVFLPFNFSYAVIPDLSSSDSCRIFCGGSFF